MPSAELEGPKASIDAIETKRVTKPQTYHHPVSSVVTEDPYTWPKWVKIGITANICANAFLNNVCAAGLVPTLSPVSAELGVPITKATEVMSYNILAQGLSNIIWVPTMLCFGKRWSILATMVILLPCIAWAAEAKTFDSLLAARIVGGFASGASESFAPVIIGDIWYEHNLTTALGFFAFSILSGAGLGQCALGYVTQGLGWRWAYWVTFIACAVNTITMFFWLPETTFERGLSVGMTAGDVERDKIEHEVEDAPPLTSMRQNLWFIKHKYVKYETSWIKTCLRPGQFFCSIPVLWSSITYALGSSGFTVIGTCIPQLFAAPPYNFNSGAQGLFGLSAMVGVLLGGTIGARIVDTFNARVEKRRFRLDLPHKPEERLAMLILPFCTVTTGLVIYGVTVQDGTMWVGPAAGYVIHSFGFATLAGITYSYSVDSYLVRSGEVMVFNNAIRALLSYGFTDFSPDWISSAGPRLVYIVLAAINWGAMLVGIPMFFFGQKLRAISDRFL